MSLRASIVGGSLGGLITGLALRRAGVEVSIHERNATSLESRGAGLRVQPVMAELFRQVLGIDLSPVCTSASRVQYIDRAGLPLHAFEQDVQYTSWGALYALLLAEFGLEHYRLGAELLNFSQDAAGVTARFADGSRARSDLLVFADGVNSVGRRLLFPHAHARYAGYLCWRGYLFEDGLSQASRAVLGDAMTIALLNPGHVHVYPIPGAVMDVAGQGRCFNYIWYRNVAEGEEFRRAMTDRNGTFRPSSVPPGAVRDEAVGELKRVAHAELPAAIAELVDRTPEPFIQAISDIDAGGMACGRVCLVGDAASGGRPHLGAATAKATINAVTLARALSSQSDGVAQVLAAWAPAQVRLGTRMTERNKALGDRLQFGADALPGDPRLRPGIQDLVDEALGLAAEVAPA